MWYSRLLGHGLCPVLASFLLLLPASFCFGATIVLDDFAAPAVPNVPVLGLPGANPSLYETADAGITGGERDVFLQVSGAAAPASFIGQDGGGSFVFNSDTPGTVGILQYDGVDADTMGPPPVLVNSDLLGGLDFASLASSFVLDFLYIEGGNFQTTGIEVEVHGAGKIATFAGSIGDSDVPLLVPIGFSDFTVAGGDWLEVFSDVTSIEFRFNPMAHERVDFALDEVLINGEPIPEPSTWVMLGTGLVGLLLSARRRRR